jgi:hypothetical protein
MNGDADDSVASSREGNFGILRRECVYAMGEGGGGVYRKIE